MLVWFLLSLKWYLQNLFIIWFSWLYLTSQLEPKLLSSFSPVVPGSVFIISDNLKCLDSQHLSCLSLTGDDILICVCLLFCFTINVNHIYVDHYYYYSPMISAADSWHWPGWPGCNVWHRRWYRAHGGLVTHYSPGVTIDHCAGCCHQLMWSIIKIKLN